MPWYLVMSRLASWYDGCGCWGWLSALGLGGRCTRNGNNAVAFCCLLCASCPLCVVAEAPVGHRKGCIAVFCRCRLSPVAAWRSLSGAAVPCPAPWDAVRATGGWPVGCCVGSVVVCLAGGGGGLGCRAWNRLWVVVYVDVCCAVSRRCCCRRTRARSRVRMASSSRWKLPLSISLLLSRKVSSIPGK